MLMNDDFLIVRPIWPPRRVASLPLIFWIAPLARVRMLVAAPM